MKLKCNITKQGDIEKLIKELEDYKEGLLRRRDIFIERLLDVGIRTAKDSTGEYAGMIRFEKEIEDGIGLLIATDGQKLIREWKFKGGVKRAEVSPLLMAEFGSGWLAKVLDDVEGVGQGTFPGQTHAFSPHGWWWTTLDGEHHHSIGESPTFPMHSASMAMIFEIDSIAKKVFR